MTPSSPSINLSPSTDTQYKPPSTIANPPSQITILAKDVLLPHVPGFTIEDLQSIPVREVRRSELPNNSLFWLLIPVIGWGILIYLKIDANKKHRNAEEIMQKFNSADDFNENLQILNNAKKAAGHLAKQYDFSAVQLYLIHNRTQEAQKIMPMPQRPQFPGHHSYRGLNLVSPKIHVNSELYSHPHILDLSTRSYLQAQLTAAVCSANKQYLNAYEALNDAAYWARKEGLTNVNPRQQQEAIVQKLFNEGGTSPRLNVILKAEETLRTQAQEIRAKVQQAHI